MGAGERRGARRIRIDDHAHDVSGPGDRVRVPLAHESSADDCRAQRAVNGTPACHAVAVLGAAPRWTDSRARTAGVSSTRRSPVDAER